MVTSRLNLFELYYILLRDTDERTALLALDKYYDFSIDFDIATIQDASKMKLTYKRRNLSMADCVGYFLAGQLGIPFLTGDCQFRDMPNVQLSNLKHTPVIEQPKSEDQCHLSLHN